MESGSRTKTQLADLILDHFQGRRDAYAVRQKQADKGGKYPYHTARSLDKSDLPLTVEAIERHLKGEETVGIYLLCPGDNKAHFGVFDLDDHSGSTPWAEMVAKSGEIIEKLGTQGLHAQRFRSRGGNGIHVWVLFDSAVNAAKLRAWMTGVLETVGLREGSDGGLAAGVCEIFPKQEKVAVSGYGNLVALPLAGKSAPIGESGDVLPTEQWLEVFQKLPTNKAGLIPALSETGKKPVGRPRNNTTLDAHPLEACAFVQHCRKNASTLSEPLWFGLASNCGVVDGGRKLFHEISKIDVTRYEVGEADLKFNRAEEAKTPHRCETLGKDGFTCPNMDPSGKCKIHGGRSPAVFALDPKVRIQFIKKQEGLHSPAKQEAISRVMLNDLCTAGNFYRTRGDGRQLFFHKTEKCLYELDGINFKAFCNESYGINGSTSLWKFCLDDTQAHCIRKGVETDTYRFARWQNKKLYIHVGGQEVFRLNGQTTETVSNGTDGILFEDSGVEPFELPDNYKGSPVRKHLIDGINCREMAYKDLFEAYVYTLFFESLLPTKPILLMNGVKGSGKTSALRAVKRALFGEHADVSTGFTKSEGDALAAITHNHFLIADNVDGMVPWLGNLMASISTGTEIAVRTLYRTNELSTFTPHCFLAITSRDPLSFKRDDLADRLFMIDVDRRTDFIAESELNQRGKENRGAIWAELLDKLNKIILAINRGGLATSSKHRLADWARLVTVIGKTLDLKDYQYGLDHLEQARRDFVLEDNAIFDGIQKWVNANKWQHKDGSPRELTTGELYVEITDLYYFVGGNTYPIKTARKFGVEFKNLLPELSTFFNISVREGRARKKHIVIQPIAEQKAA